MALRLLLLGTFFVALKADSGEVGLLRADPGKSPGSKPDQQEEVFCLAYNPDFKHLPATYDGQPSSALADYSQSDGCSAIHDDIKGKVVAVSRGNCTFTEKAAIIESGGGIAAVVVDFANESSLSPPGGNTTDYNAVNITVATIRHSDYDALLNKKKEVRVWLYAPLPPSFDPNIIVMFSLATLCVVTGAYLAATAHHSKKQRRVSKEGKEDDEEEDKKEETVSLGMGVAMSICLVVFFFGSLTLLYFFYDYLVYFIIAIFCLAGVNGLFQALLPLWKKLVPCDAQVPCSKMPCGSRPPQVRSLVLVLLCIGFVAVWVVFRHQSFAWILQDIIGFCFCLYVMKALIMPSLRACTVLLCLLFIYDIFFVFITPLFTKNGESVMIKVATGGDTKTGEQMPTVFKLPYFLSWAMSQCFTDKYSLLGYGDVIVPGLLVTYNCAFDFKTRDTAQGRWEMLYFTATSLAYVVGLVLTGCALYLMKSGQPALLYLVPCTLLTTFAIATYRGELKHMWHGHQCPKKDDDIRPPAATSATSSDFRDNEDDEDEEMTTERQSLIQ